MRAAKGARAEQTNFFEQLAFMDTVPTVAQGLTRIATHVHMSPTRVYVMDPERSGRVRTWDPRSVGWPWGPVGFIRGKTLTNRPFVFSHLPLVRPLLSRLPMSIAQDPFFLNHHLQMATVAAEGHKQLTPPHASRSATPSQSNVNLLVNFVHICLKS